MICRLFVFLSICPYPEAETLHLKANFSWVNFFTSLIFLIQTANIIGESCLVCWQKTDLLVLRRVGLCVRQNLMCRLWGCLKLVLKSVRWIKIKIQKRWLLGRLNKCSFVLSFIYVLCCRSFLLCRSLGLQVTVCNYKQ